MEGFTKKFDPRHSFLILEPPCDDPSFWETARVEGLGDWLELDLDDFVRTHVENFITKHDNTVWQILRQTATWADGRQAVYNQVIDELKKAALEPEIMFQLLHNTVDVLGGHRADLKLSPPFEICPLVANLRRSNEKRYHEAAQQFVEQFTDPNGRQTVYDQVIDELKKAVIEPEVMFQLLHNTVDILGGHPANLTLSPSIKIDPLVVDLRRSNEKRYREIAQQFVERFTDPDGRQAVYDQVIEKLKKVALEPKVMFQLLHKTVDILGGHPANLKLSPSIEICPLIADLRRNNEKCYQETAQQFVEQFTDPCIFVLSGHRDWIRSVAFSPDGRRVVLASNDKTIRIWDAETGKPVGEPFRGHTMFIPSVAFSPDGRRILSSSYDDTIRIWDAEAGKPVRDLFQGHTKLITSVAFSPDGRRVVSILYDNTIQIWDAETGKPLGEPFQGHTEWVTSVAFSPDGRRVVSGSYDETVRIWDAETGKPVGGPFRGHTNGTASVAFSPDGRRVLSGSYDETIQMWDAETGKPVGGPFRGHTDMINSVSFSPDGRHIVSGSDDNTIRIWDAETGKPVGEPYRGHTDSVNSVAFSPDGRCVVSGSDDKTIRIWDAETRIPVGEPLRGPTDPIMSVVFSDNRHVLSGPSNDRVGIQGT